MGDVELALKSKGCEVSYSTSTYGSYDDCSKIIDGQRNTYWSTTGLYPHIFILSFSNPVVITSIRIRSYLVKLMSIEKSSVDTPQQFEEVSEKELHITEHCHQVENLHKSKFVARHLRFTIKSGYDHTCAVYRVEVNGIQNKSGEISQSFEKIEAVEIASSQRSEVGKDSLLAIGNESPYTLSPSRSVQSTPNDGSKRFSNRLSKEHGENRTSSSMSSPRNKDEEEDDTLAPFQSNKYLSRQSLGHRFDDSNM